MAAPRRRQNFSAMEDEMDERKMMEEEMNRFEQEILTGQDDDDDDDNQGRYPPAPPIVPPGIPQALSVLGTPDPSLMNLRFPAPPIVPTLAAAPRIMPAPASAEPVGTHHQPRDVPMGFPVLTAPAQPGTIPTSTAIELPGSYQQPRFTHGQRLPMSSHSSSQPFPPGVQQMSGETTHLAPRPAFVPHQVRVRAPIAAHRPPVYQMEQQPRLPHPQAPGFMHPMAGPRIPMNYPMQPHRHGIPQGLMASPGYPMMHQRPMGMMQQSPAVIQAKPTTYSAKPVKFSRTKKAQQSEESPGAETAGTIKTAQPEYSAQTPAIAQPPAFTQSTIPHNQVPMQMYAAASQSVAVDYSSMAQQQQQHTEAAAGSSSAEPKKKEKKKKFIRTAASTVWEDDSLAEWDPSDFRIFCGDLGNEVTDDLLTKVFGRYPSFTKAKVVRDKRTSKSKGYGFVSFKDPNDFVQAMREWNGKYVGNRPIKLRKSTWKDRNIDMYKKKQKEKQRLGLR